MVMAGPASFSIRFRLVDGVDVGPNLYEASTTVGALKESLLTNWGRSPGAASSQTPSATTEMRLILAGKFLDNAATLEQLRGPMGSPPDSETVVTMHLLISSPPPSAAAGAAGDAEKVTNPCAKCTIM